MRYILSFFILFITGCMPIMAYNLDTSVDKEIQKKYDADKLNKDMQVSSSKKDTIQTSDKKNSDTITAPKAQLDFSDNSDKPTISAENKTYKKDGIKIPKWTSFKVKSKQKISNWMSVGSSVSFSTTSPVYKKYITIQTGTVFYGKVVKIHNPQFSGNGALVEIQITSMAYDGKTYPADGKITKADSDLIFFNKIKGERQYINGVKKKVNSATNFYKKTRTTSNKLSQNPIGTVLSPFPTIVGIIGGAAGTIISPVTGLVEKGKNISLPEGTSFEIRLLDDIYINK